MRFDAPGSCTSHFKVGVMEGIECVAAAPRDHRSHAFAALEMTDSIAHAVVHEDLHPAIEEVADGALKGKRRVGVEAVER